MAATVYLVPTFLHEEGLQTIPSYVLDAVRQCQSFFVEEQKTARRYLKKLDKRIVIDDYEWFTITEENPNIDPFMIRVKQGQTIGIISEAGCPGIADPGQQLVAVAQQLGVKVKPLVGPNSILLALMASGMNGQRFRFHGYLPIRDHERNKTIKDLETASAKTDCTQIFIETPYRNDQLLDALVKNCQPSTRICLAVDLTGRDEFIKTKPVSEWKNNKPTIHKRPAIFLLHASS